jgi:hypothetical protein
MMAVASIASARGIAAPLRARNQKFQDQIYELSGEVIPQSTRVQRGDEPRDGSMPGETQDKWRRKSLDLQNVVSSAKHVIKVAPTR